MAEILLSLTIIGVVAAITLPSLTGNINERTWNTQRKALYARMSQAISLMPALNGYGTSSTSPEDTAAETFITEGLAKVLKINNICNSEHLADCGITSKITTIDGDIAFSQFPTNLSSLNSMLYGGAYEYYENGSLNYKFSDPNAKLNTKAVAFETQNGESIVAYYNPNCQSDMKETQWSYSQSKMCVNFIYDLNGNKGPNTTGKDIGFMSVLYATDSTVVAPMPLQRPRSTSSSHYDAQAMCKSQDSDSRMPNIYELMSMFYNKALIGTTNTDAGSSGIYWSSSLASVDKAWDINFQSGDIWPMQRNGSYKLWCVKR